MLAAIKAGNIDKVRILINREDPSAFGNNAFKLAAGRGNIEIMNLLIEDSRVYNTIGNDYILGWAVSNGFISAIKILLEASHIYSTIILRWSFETAVQYAVSHNQFESLDTLLGDSRINPKSKDHESLRNAVKKNYVDIAVLLIRDPRYKPCKFRWDLLKSKYSNNMLKILTYFARRRLIIKQLLFDYLVIDLFPQIYIC